MATAQIPPGTFILSISGIASSTSTPEHIGKFSIVQRKNGMGPYNALLAGPIRFVNHRCTPNAEVCPNISPIRAYFD